MRQCCLIFRSTVFIHSTNIITLSIHSFFRAEYSPCVMPQTTIFTESWLLGYNHLTIYERVKVVLFWHLPLDLKLWASVSCPPYYMTYTSLARWETSPISMSNPWATSPTQTAERQFWRLQVVTNYTHTLQEIHQKEHVSITDDKRLSSKERKKKQLVLCACSAGTVVSTKWPPKLQHIWRTFLHCTACFWV
jgi:hypothetical protein